MRGPLREWGARGFAPHRDPRFVTGLSPRVSPVASPGTGSAKSGMAELAARISFRSIRAMIALLREGGHDLENALSRKKARRAPQIRSRNCPASGGPFAKRARVASVLWRHARR